MKVGVDITWMVGQYRGMGRFARQLIAPVAADVIGLGPAGVQAPEWPGVSQGRGFFPWWEQVELPRLCAGQRLDYLLCPYNTGPLRSLGPTRLISVVHDLIFLLPFSTLPPSLSAYQNVGRMYRRWVVPALARRADVLLTVSHYTRDQLVTRLGVAEQRVQVIPNAIADDWLVARPATQQARLPYLFTVSGEAPSKNVHRLLQAFAQAKTRLDSPVGLRVAGIKAAHHAHFQRYAESLGLRGCVEWLGYLTETELRQQYRQARGFVFPSLFEGFGIPVLEAMASGTPVASSHATSMPEIIGAHGIFFDPRSVDEMARQIERLWHGGSAIDAMAHGALQRARSYSESAVADAMRMFWERLQ